MTIDRRKFLAASSSALVLAKSQVSSAAYIQPSETPEPLEIRERIEGKEVKVYTTADNSNYRLSATDTLLFKDLRQPLETQICVFVDPAKTFQTILGIGGALTDASAETFSKLPGPKQREILNAYFDPRIGIGYTLARTNIHSCDFSSGSYTYADEGDKGLKSFSVSHDKQFRIPFIKQALATAGGRLNIFGSPWSPPAFMPDFRSSNPKRSSIQELDGRVFSRPSRKQTLSKKLIAALRWCAPRSGAIAAARIWDICLTMAHSLPVCAIA